MRVYAFLLLATFAIAARAATIPDNTISEKKVDAIPEDKDKAPENVSSEQELVDITNLITDVDNKLRAKPEDIPVDIIVENVDPMLKISDEEEIIRPAVDLRNPGPPQRQEHETQNPEFYAAEQNMVETYKKNLNDAQVVLRQGFQGVNEGIQNSFKNNEQVQTIQNSIDSLREKFTEQINRFNGSIQGYLNSNDANKVSSAEQQIKTEFQAVETSLAALKNDFTRGVDTLSNGVEAFGSLKAESEPSKPASSPVQSVIQMMQNFQHIVQENFVNMSQSVTNIFNIIQGQGSTTAKPTGQPAGAQSDTPVANATQPASPWPNFPNPFNNILPSQSQNNQGPQTGEFGSGSGPIVQVLQSLQNQFTQFLRPGAQTPAGAQVQQPAQQTQPQEPAPSQQKPSQQAQPEKPQESEKPQEPAAQASQAAPVTPDGPIRQILQNNPISQGIANVVQRLQNANNPDKPRDQQKELAVAEDGANDDKQKGHGGHPPGAGDNNDVDRVTESKPEKEVQKDTPEEVQAPMKEVTEQKTEEVVDKTE